MTIPISFSSSMLFTLFTGFTVFTSFTVSRFYLLHYFHNFSHILERTQFPSVLDIILYFSFHKLLWLTSLCFSYQVSELAVYCGNMLTQRSQSTIKYYQMISWVLADQFSADLIRCTFSIFPLHLNCYATDYNWMIFYFVLWSSFVFTQPNPTTVALNWIKKMQFFVAK